MNIWTLMITPFKTWSGWLIESFSLIDAIWRRRTGWVNMVQVMPCCVEAPTHYLNQGSWWRHQMETVSALLAICAVNSPVPGEFPHKGQWRGALMFSLIWARINGWVNNPEAGDLRRHPTHCDVIVMVDVSSMVFVPFKWGQFRT